MTRVTGKPVDQIMKTYVDQTGAPVLSVRTELQRRAATELTLTQQRFYGTPGSGGAVVVGVAGVDACRCAIAQPGPGAALRADEGHRRRRSACRAAAGAAVHQRREPRLLLLRVRPGGGAGARARPPRTLKALGARDARRRRVAHDPRRTPRHRHLSRPGRGRGRRRHARRSSTTWPRGSARWRPRSPTPISAPPTRPGFAPASGRCSSRWACRAGRRTPTACRGAAPRCSMLLGDTADDAGVQQRARTLALGLPRRPLSGPAQHRHRRPPHGRGRRRSRAVRPLRRGAAEDARDARGVLPLPQRARLLPRSGARHAHAGVRALDRRAVAGCADADRPAAGAAGIAGSARGRSSRTAGRS